MLTYLDCLVDAHDWRLVVVAVLVCLLSTTVTFRLYAQAVAGSGAARLVLLPMMALTSAIGTWATHFIAMLAFRPLVPTAYDPILTGISLLVALLVMGTGFAVATRFPRRLPRAASGLLVGLGIGAMHYTGMLAFLTPGVLAWTPSLVVMSLVAGPLLAAASLYVFGDGKGWRMATSVAIMAAAISGLHFTGMSAVTLTFDPGIVVPEHGLSRTFLTLFVLSGALAMVFMAVLGLFAEKRSSTDVERRLREISDATVEGIVICRDGVIADANLSFCAMAGTGIDDLVDRPFGSLFQDVTGEATVLTGGTSYETQIVRVSGDPIPVLVQTRQGGVDFPGRRVFSVRDLREQRASEQRIRFLAHHDALTGLPNRVTFQDALAAAIGRTKRGAAPIAVLCLDLDRFKWVNDTLGHKGGDELLKAVARRLSGCLRETDLVARLGGDEFVILQVDNQDPAAPGLLANRIIAEISRPYEIGGSQAVIGISVGIACTPTDGLDAEALMRNADTALYRAKADGRIEGRGWYSYFEPGMDALMQDRIMMDLDLRKAMALGEFSLAYQPLVTVASGRITGLEALLRWTSPTRGSVSPADFIPLAEQTGLIIEIGEWVLDRACADAAGWEGGPRIAVNLSPVQFRSRNLVDAVSSALATSGLDPSRLELEVTESLLLENTQDVLETLRRLKALGVTISMDDFGTGYSSLSYLRSFPFDKIKIDQSFIRDVATSSGSMAIIRAVTGLSAALGMTTTAEGVETEEQYAQLSREGCTQVQGYLFSKPVPAALIPAMLAGDVGHHAASFPKAA